MPRNCHQNDKGDDSKNDPTNHLPGYGRRVAVVASQFVAVRDVDTLQVLGTTQSPQLWHFVVAVAEQA